MKREVRYPFPIRSRLDKATGEALQQAADDRGVEIGSLVRLLIEAGLGRLDRLSPVRRLRAPVRQPAEFAAAVSHLGSLAGNLQRLYATLLERRRIDDSDLLAIKADVRATARKVRDALGEFDGA